MSLVIENQSVDEKRQVVVNDLYEQRLYEIPQIISMIRSHIKRAYFPGIMSLFRGWHLTRLAADVETQFGIAKKGDVVLVDPEPYLCSNLRSFYSLRLGRNVVAHQSFIEKR